MQERNFNRELSWLAFNERVLLQATSEQVPLLSRLRFLSIFSSNLDEFFMVRVGSLCGSLLVGNSTTDCKTLVPPTQQLNWILPRVRQLYRQRDQVFSALLGVMREAQLTRLRLSALSKKQRSFAVTHFRERILPVLSPIIIDNRHPFPFLENRVKYLVVRLKANKRKKSFGIVRLGDTVDSALFFDGGATRFVLCEDLLLSMASEVFTSYEIAYAAIIRATRNAECDPANTPPEHDMDCRRQMRSLLKRRERLAPVRLEVYKKKDDDMAAFLQRHTAVDKSQIFFSRSPLDYAFLSGLEETLSPARRAGLSEPPLRPPWPAGLSPDRSVIAQVRQRDFLLIHPYESLDPVVELLREAGLHKSTVSIHMSVYRLGADSQIVAGLCRAAENGKQVTVTLELRARFDERNNLRWSHELEEAGCQLLYGLDGYKTHAKALLVTLREAHGVSYITHLSTGNYHEKTARQYADVGLLTAHAGIGREVKAYFDNLALSHLGGRYRHLLMAPAQLRTSLCDLIDKEIAKSLRGQPARIMMKMNGLTDKTLIDKLMEASQAGVPIGLVVRGICCLRPGVPGLSDTIEVVSIIGRFLEHARVFCFGAGPTPTVYLSSADGMTRNMERRVEMAIPILAPPLASRLCSLLRTQLADNVGAWRLLPDGSYVRKTGSPALDCQKTPFSLFPGTASVPVDPPSHPERSAFLWPVL